MPIDVVIDTNVLVHANNNDEPRQPYSIDLIQCILQNEELLTVDLNFTFGKAANVSYISHEYNKHLVFGMVGFHFIIEMIARNRINFVSSAVVYRLSRMINQNLHNPYDRFFLRVTYNSLNKTLISHDWEDFTTANRRLFEGALGVEIIEASDYLGL